MGLMMDQREDRFDEFLRQAAREYNAPPETPRAEIWDRIQAERRKGGTAERGTADVLPFRPTVRRTVRPAARAPFRLALGIAALLAIGVAIGRFTALYQSNPAAAPGANTAATPPEKQDRRAIANEVATAEHLSRVETFLIDFRTRPESPEFSAEAHDLLGTTRLLLDSRRVTDPRTRKLLEDLELVLTQIAALDSHDRREDLDFIADGLDRSHVRTRLRNAIPAGPAIRM
jgi:hypothetical protein